MNNEAVTNDATKRKITIALFVATFLAAIEGTIVGTAMPSITRELQGIEKFSWIISIYLLATVITTPIFGKLSDLYGRKNVFIAGAIIFLTGSALSGLAQSIDQLIWFRAVQGLGAGALITIPYTIIGDLYNFEQRAKIQGWLSSIWGIAGISGPLVGGLFVDYVSWRAIFYMNIPFGIAAIYLLSSSLKESIAKKKQHIDFPGVIVFSLAMICFLYGMSLIDTRGSGDTSASVLLIGALLLAAVCLLAWFIYIEKKSPEPMIPLELFKNKTISISNLESFLFCILVVAVTFYLPLWMQGVYNKSATYSGIMMIPLSITWPLGSILAGNLIARAGLKRLCFLGAIILLIGTFGFTTLHADSAMLWFAVYSALCGLGFGFISTSITIAVTSAVGMRMRGAAVASNNFIRTIGQTVGITIFGLMLHTGKANEIEPAILQVSMHRIFTIAAIIAIVIIAVAFIMPKRDERDGIAAQQANEAK